MKRTAPKMPKLKVLCCPFGIIGNMDHGKRDSLNERPTSSMFDHGMYKTKAGPSCDTLFYFKYNHVVKMDDGDC